MDISREFRFLQQKVRRLEAEATDTAAKVRGINLPPTHQSLFVKASGDIQPQESGVCVCLSYIVSESSGENKASKTEIPQVKINVRNNLKTTIWEGEEFVATRDAFGNYYRLTGIVDTSFFLVPDGGIPAGTGKFNPNGTDCQRYYFDKQRSYIDPVEDPSTGGPVFEFVWNHTESKIAAGKVIQAKKIDGEWFVDVEPC